MIDWHTILWCCITLGSVSYTHLETDDFTLEQHVAAIQKHSFPEAVDIVITHNNRAEPHILEKYKDMGSEPVRVAQEAVSYTHLDVYKRQMRRRTGFRYPE